MITTIRKSPWLREILFLFIFSSIFTAFNFKTIAQIIPDKTLGAEKSRVTPSGVKDVIEGGAIRNDNLFHSFTEFNVSNGQQVYFANPVGINNILTRVTGSNISRIFGTLGVNGGANLFLINPNGIIFGTNAKLDVAGSFTATTANSLIFNNYEFSATNPTAPPLLKINVTPGLQYGTIQPLRQISNQGNLSVGQDLTLVGDVLNLQGQLDAANNLTLISNNTTIRDNTTQPFIASAGGNLLVQGNQKLDIFALNHPNSGFFSGGDITLRSANPISGDAHYTSRGNFLITSPLTGGTEGGLGELFSLYDPVIKAGGDVLIGSYIGASLHIIAAGKVEIPQFIRITGADANQGLQETITLSDNTIVAIDGKARPTLDIRAGVDPAAIGTPILPATGAVGFGSPRNFSNTPTSADIKVGTILFANTANTLISGQVFLTNQYRPNPNLQGDIQINNTFGAIGILNNGLTGSRSVNIGSKGSITLNGSIDTSAIAVNNKYSDNGGDVRLLSGGNIIFNNGADLSSFGLLGGNITLKSNGDISFTNANVLSNSYTNVPSITGGDITLAAKSIFINNGSNLIARTYGQGNAGKVTVAASESVFLAEDSNIRSNVEQGASGNANGIEITAKTIELNRGSDLTSETSGAGNAGNIQLTASGAIKIDGENSEQDTSSIRTRVLEGSTGNSGTIEITAGSLSVTNGGFINASTQGRGNAGNINIKVASDLKLDGESIAGEASGIFSEVNSQAVGNPGSIQVTAGSISVLGGAQISSSTAGQGNAGNITINAGSNFSLDGGGRQGFSSLITSGVNSGAVGNAGNIELTANSVSIKSGTRINSSVTGEGNAGNVKITAKGNIELDGENRFGFGSAISSSVDFGAVGNGGNIELTAGSLSLTKGGNILAATGGKGRSNAGNITINVSGDVRLDGETSKGFGTGIASNVAPGVIGDGGAIKLTASNLSLSNGGQIATGIFGEGKGGDITINLSGAARADGENSLGFTSGIYSNIDINRNTNIDILRNTNGVGVGSSGKIDFQAGSLSLTNGAGITANVRGEGNAGKISVVVKGDVLLDRISRFYDSGIYSNVEPGAVGKAEGIELTANSLSVSNGAQLASSALGREGNAGFLSINTKELLVRDGGLITVRAANSQNAGDLHVKATNVTLDSSIITAQTDSGSEGNINLNIANTLNLRNNSRVSAATVNGEGGRLQVNANSVNINNSAITTEATGEGGIAGAIDIIGNNLQLNDNSRVLATTASGNGGDIIMNLADLLLLRRGSSISTTAGQAPGGGDGGNININSRFVVAVPIENSNITGNAYTGRGGNITITTNGIYGFESGAQPSFNRSNITASSALGINGTIIFNIENVDPSRGLTELPSVPTDPTNQIAAGCPASGDASFVVTGRGGLPDNPKTTRLGQVVLQDFRATATGSIASNGNNELEIENNQLPIIEAQSLVLDKQGNAELVANIPYNSRISLNNDIDCQGLRRATKGTK
ncbi:MAG: filamentous hemagglutinin N-terminal domain-containing protein [Calothrix sp. FI2-JRJ7]|nr:filamentous hemagglutinin N-terminal domain-containing protein [Calothrix sp. FI2-JRJ7]